MIFLYFWICVLIFTNGLQINMDRRKNYFFYRDVTKGEKIHISYVSSGKGETKVGLKITLM